MFVVFLINPEEHQSHHTPGQQRDKAPDEVVDDDDANSVPKPRPVKPEPKVKAKTAKPTTAGHPWRRDGVWERGASFGAG